MVTLLLVHDPKAVQQQRAPKPAEHFPINLTPTQSEAKARDPSSTNSLGSSGSSNSNFETSPGQKRSRIPSHENGVLIPGGGVGEKHQSVIQLHHSTSTLNSTSAAASHVIRNPVSSTKIEHVLIFKGQPTLPPDSVVRFNGQKAFDSHYFGGLHGFTQQPPQPNGASSSSAYPASQCPSQVQLVKGMKSTQALKFKI